MEFLSISSDALIFSCRQKRRDRVSFAMKKISIKSPLKDKRPIRSLHRADMVPPRDMRTPLAKARDEWLASAEGQKCSNPASIALSPTDRQYLENRLVSAFLAGANLADEHAKNPAQSPAMAGVVPCREEMVSEETPLVPGGSVAGNHCTGTGAKAGVTCVFVLAKNKKPLMPCHPARAKELLNKGKAIVVKRFPFTIQLRSRTAGEIQHITEASIPPRLTDGVSLAP